MIVAAATLARIQKQKSIFTGPEAGPFYHWKIVCAQQGLENENIRLVTYALVQIVSGGHNVE